MARVEKTVFISYRRTNAFMALAIYQHLTAQGYDVFLDYTGIASGDFESSILENVRARSHFLIVLTPSALERLAEPGDWLRREIETAIESGRNIVPLMFEGFDFGSPTVAKQLTGALAVLPRYQGLGVPPEYFDAAMEKLRTKYLNIPLQAVPHPPSAAAQRAAETQRTAAAAAPAVQEAALTAEQWFERGYRATDNNEAVHAYSEAIRLKPDFAEAYFNRNLARHALGDLDGALADCGIAIRLKPDAAAYSSRGVTRQALGDLDGALADSETAIRLQPDDGQMYYNRGVIRTALGDRDGALADYSTAIRLKPDHPDAYYNRGLIRRRQRQYTSAIADYRKYLELGGGVRDGDQAEVEGFIRQIEGLADAGTPRAKRDPPHRRR